MRVKAKSDFIYIKNKKKVQRKKKKNKKKVNLGKRNETKF